MDAEIESILLNQCGLRKDRPIIAGVSGGADSLCLLSLLHEAGWQAIAAHFNHRLRAEADEDAAAVKSLAARLGIPFAGGAGNVRQYATGQKVSIETAARELRYRFLFAQARHHGAQAVAVGHTADDQVETVLMHFIRGAGLNGLKGMPYRTVLRDFDGDIPLVRPLLDMWRTDTAAYCASHGLEVHYDSSNDSMDFLRNRLRHELIPVLETYNPRFREALWRSGKTLAADHAILNSALEPLWQKCVIRQGEGYVAFDLAFLSAQSPGVQMHLLGRAVQWLLPGHDTGYDDLQRAATFLAEPEQDQLDFTGGLFLLREGNLLFVAASEAALPSHQWPQMPPAVDEISCSSQFETELADGWRFTCNKCAAAGLNLEQAWQESNRFEAFLDASGLQGQLKVRVRRDGDRFEPLGMDGHSQKLSDFFINAKLPVRARARWPVVSAGDEIVWVPGYRPAHRHRLRGDSTSVLHLAVLPPK